MNDVPNIQKIYKCECHTEGIVIDYDEELDIITFHPWQWGFYTVGLRERIRYAWYILRKGTPYESIVLHPATAKELVDDINAFCDNSPTFKVEGIVQ